MARKTKLEQRTEHRGDAPVRRRKADPLAWRRALKLAGGDARRLRVQDDGSVLVTNHR